MKRRIAAFVSAALLTAACQLAGMDAYNAGVQHQSRGESTLAEQQFKIALQQQPDLAEAHLNLGTMYLNDGWLDGSEQETRAAIQIIERTKRTYVSGATADQTLSIAYNNLGLVQVRRATVAAVQGDATTARASWAEGIANLNKAVTLDPSDSKAQANLQQFKDLFR